jgi:hypothetical protein
MIHPFSPGGQPGFKGSGLCFRDRGHSIEDGLPVHPICIRVDRRHEEVEGSKGWVLQRKRSLPLKAMRASKDEREIDEAFLGPFARLYEDKVDTRCARTFCSHTERCIEERVEGLFRESLDHALPSPASAPINGATPSGYHSIFR